MNFKRYKALSHWASKSSNKFLSIEKQMKGIQMSFPTDWFLKSCTVSAKTSRDEVMRKLASLPPVSSYLLPVPDGVDSDVPELSLQGHSCGAVTSLSNLGPEFVLL